uniref:class I adenylate-forming enzyme family protein n=1 Tax=Nocardia brasiliensis TaxID=37326 RepID=UPI002454CDE8
MAPHTESILQSADSDPLLTRRQFDSWTETFAARLRAVGVGPGDVVALNMPNCAAFVTTLHAVWQTGAACAPLNPVLTAREKAVLVDLVQPKLVVSCADPVPAGPVVTWGDPSGEPPEIERSRVRSVASGSAAAEDRLVLFTSGSSGTPKAVALTEDNVDAGIASVAEHFRLSEHDRTVAMLPWSHGHGLFASVLAPLRSGGTVVVATQKEMQQPHRLLTAARPTWLTVVPPQLELIIGAVERDAIEPPRMRFVRTASSPLARVSAQRAEDRLQCPAVEALGLTETSHQAAADRPTWNRRPGTVGVATGGMAVRISGENVLGGGELEVRGPGLFRGYLGNAPPDKPGPPNHAKNPTPPKHHNKKMRHIKIK